MITKYPDKLGFRKKLTRGWAHRPSLTNRDLQGIEAYLKTGDPKFLPLTYKIIRKGMREHGVFDG